VLPAFLATPGAKAEKPSVPPTPGRPASTRIEIEPTEGEFGKILKRPGEK
jgi:hypothetical protein